jgi:hypothetical protein
MRESDDNRDNFFYDEDVRDFLLIFSLKQEDAYAKFGFGEPRFRLLARGMYFMFKSIRDELVDDFGDRILDLAVQFERLANGSHVKWERLQDYAESIFDDYAFGENPN